jgi:hypothetical protein
MIRNKLKKYEKTLQKKPLPLEKISEIVYDLNKSELVSLKFYNEIIIVFTLTVLY